MARVVGVIIGAHVDKTDPVAAAQARGASASQFFLGNPQSYQAPSVAYAGGAEELKQAAVDAGVELWVHAPYLINVASLNNRLRIPSRKLLQQVVSMAATVGARGVIVHGGHLTEADNPEIGFDNWRKCVDGLQMDVPILIENTAGGANAMTRHLESIDRLWTAIASAKNSDRVGFCLDTCHAHAAGLDLTGLVDRVKAITGRVDLVHLNDSRDAFDSGADRHANLGRGHCDPEGLADVVKAAATSVIIETPGDVDEHRADLAWVREHT